MASSSKRRRQSPLEVQKDCEFEDKILQDVLKSIDDETEIIDSLEDETLSVQPSTNSKHEHFDQYESEAENLKQIVKTIQMKRCYVVLKYSYDDILETSRNIAENSTNLADKIVDIAVKNTVGNLRIENIEFDAHETMLNKCLDLYSKDFYRKKHLCTPLFYQCYLCGLAWWHLYPFKEHIKIHDPTKFTVQYKAHNSLVFIIASAAHVNAVVHLKVDGVCSRCGQESRFHIRTEYLCLACKVDSFGSCEEMADHMFIHCEARVNIQRVQCRICNYFVDKQLLEEHLSVKHAVRSDLPMPVHLKDCKRCPVKYHNYTTHRCPHFRQICIMCEQKFISPLATALHKNYGKEIISCRICNMKVQKCREIAHMLKHTKNYMMVFQCGSCENSNLFLENYIAYGHLKSFHTERFKHKSAYMLPFPQECIKESAVILVRDEVEATPLEDIMKKNGNRLNATDCLVETCKPELKLNKFNNSLHKSNNEDNRTNNAVSDADIQHNIDDSDSQNVHETDIDVIEDDNDVIKDDIDVIEDDNDILKDDIDVIEDASDVIENNIDAIKDDIDVIKGDDDVIEDDIVVIKDDDDVIEDDNVVIKDDIEDNVVIKDDIDVIKDDDDDDVIEDDNVVIKDDIEDDNVVIKDDNDVIEDDNVVIKDDIDVIEDDNDVNEYGTGVNEDDIDTLDEEMNEIDKNIKVKELIGHDDYSNYEDILSKVFNYKN